ncbi:MAG: hypothetical protein Q9195_000539 [Heterodermia aff. obscurata]
MTVPILSAAKNLSLPVHEIDTFTGWTPPATDGRCINLVVAVSFGLLVPPRIINGAKYGGMNVHPSLLPNFRGAAPLHHTLLSGTEVTGVSLQTLHPSKFDHGVILAQTTPFEHGAQTVQELEEILSPIGAQLLLQGIRDRAYVTPPKETTGRSAPDEEKAIHHAPKLSAADRHIDWQSWTAERIVRTHKVIGPLWNYFSPADGKPSKQTRLIWSSGFRESPECPEYIKPLVPSAGHPIIVGLQSPTQDIYIRTCDGHVLQSDYVKVEGDITRSFVHAARRTRMIGLSSGLDESSQDFKLFDCSLS